MSRRDNKGYYVPIGNDLYKSPVQKFTEKYKLPSHNEMLFAAGTALAAVLAIVIILFVSGVRIKKAENDLGADYRYFGWMFFGKPTVGFLCGTDGTNATVFNGDIHYEDGSVYSGELNNFMKHGKGTLTFSDGSSYSGEFKYGKYDGQGELKGTNGEGYSGGYSEGKYNGMGRLVFSDGAVYEGEFEEGDFEGKGTVIYMNGDSFTGTFENGMKEYGVYSFADGSSIEGKFRNNEPIKTENIIYTDIDGRSFIAEYNNGDIKTISSYIKPTAPEEERDPDAVG